MRRRQRRANKGTGRLMKSSTEKLIAVLDVGSATTRIVVGEHSDGVLRYRGHGVAESRGTRKGAIVEVEKAADSIHRAVEQAEKISGASIGNCVVAIGGPLLRGINSRGGLSLGPRARDITRDDLRQAIDRARSVVLPVDREVLHLLPQEYLVNEQSGIRDPLGMTGTTLEVSIHMITGASSAKQTIVNAANRAGISVDDVVFEGIAAAECSLPADDRELGVCLMDIGAGTTELTVYCEGAVAHTGVVPLGGDHFTNDVAVGLRTPLADAEKIKRSFGHAVVTAIPEANEIEVPGVGDKPSRLMSQRLLAEVLEARARELFDLVRENLRQGGMLGSLGAGVMLGGGGSRLPGLLEMAESMLRCHARTARSAPIAKMPAALFEPEFAVAVGGLMYTHRSRVARSAPAQQGLRERIRAIFQIA